MGLYTVTTSNLLANPTFSGLRSSGTRKRGRICDGWTVMSRGPETDHKFLLQKSDRNASSINLRLYDTKGWFRLMQEIAPEHFEATLYRATVRLRALQSEPCIISSISILEFDENNYGHLHTTVLRDLVCTGEEAQYQTVFELSDSFYSDRVYFLSIEFRSAGEFEIDQLSIVALEATEKRVHGERQSEVVSHGHRAEALLPLHLPETNLLTETDKASYLALAHQAFAEKAFQVANFYSTLFVEAIQDYITVSSKKKRRNPKYSIIILTHKNSDDFLSNIEDLKKFETITEYELIFVDNGNGYLSSILQHKLQSYVLVSSSVNLGCSLGRNVGVQVASGQSVIFLDDDGQIADGAIENLIDVRQKFDAVAVRGRVFPKTQGSHMPAHYDRGDRVIPNAPDAEGISLWDRQVFLDFGGFDPLLAGHEGIDLMLRMYPFYGPYKFIYTPDAVLYHDFHSSQAELDEKHTNRNHNWAYMTAKGEKPKEIVRTIGSIAESPAMHASFLQYPELLELLRGSGNAKPKRARKPSVSIITVAQNATTVLEDYSRSLKQQSFSDFELVFVDDHSSDGTYEKIEMLWQGDKRLNLIRAEMPGRSSSLNAAINIARGDILVFADVDCISTPNRLTWTLQYFSEYPDQSCLSFHSYTDKVAAQAPLPVSSKIEGIRARSFVGMPVVFSAFACRKSFVKVAFDVELSLGVECEWILRNLSSVKSDGHFLSVPAVYQCTRNRREKPEDKHAITQSMLDALFRYHCTVHPEIPCKFVEQIGDLHRSGAGGGQRNVEETSAYISEMAPHVLSAFGPATGTEIVNYMQLAARGGSDAAPNDIQSDPKKDSAESGNKRPGQVGRPEKRGGLSSKWNFLSILERAFRNKRSLKSQELISVCVPVYNRPKRIVRCIRSLLEQSHETLEVIVWDDGSTDSTPDVVLGLKDSRVRLVRNETNRGNVACRNDLFDLAEGKFIAIMDSDDICYPDRIALQLDALSSGFDICGGWLDRFSVDSKDRSTWQMPQYADGLIPRSLFGSPIANPSVMVTRDFLNRTKFKFDAQYFPAADYHAWAKSIVLENAAVTVVQQPLLKREVHAKSISMSQEDAQWIAAGKVRQFLLVSLGVDDCRTVAALNHFARYGNLDCKEDAELLVTLCKQILPKLHPEKFSTQESQEYFSNRLRKINTW